MICVSVTPKSRRFAKVDLLNASRNCDMIELCLDHLIKEPDVGDMISGIDKPIIVSCRRQKDGGLWEGSEADRLQLLRNAIIADPTYIELDLDIANKVPRFGNVKRVVSFTSISKPLGKVDDVFEAAYQAKADVVKFTWPTPTLEAAWPLLAAVTKKRELPVVGMGIGKSSISYSLLGRKFGSPWVYAALEKGMEAHAGQATVFELQEDFGWNEIDRTTKFVGVAGTDEQSMRTVNLLNKAFQKVGTPHRCLPFEPGTIGKLARMLDALKIKGMIIAPASGSTMLEFAEQLESTAADSGYIDLCLKRDDGWNGYNTIWRSALKAIERAMPKSSNTERPLDRRTVLLLGAGGITDGIAHGIAQRHGRVSIASPDDVAARQAAKRLDVRHVPFATIYDTLCDVVIITDPNIQAGHKKTELNPAFLRENMTFADLSHFPAETAFLEEAKLRGCRVVDSNSIYANQLSSHFKTITGKEFPAEVL
jgi:3-dehydroquinate dehydratase/shikimate dehydrogenase